MQWISDYRGTVTAGPNFSWVLATRALQRMSGLDLSSLRVALNGAEPSTPPGGVVRRRGPLSTVFVRVQSSPRSGMPGGDRRHFPSPMALDVVCAVDQTVVALNGSVAKPAYPRPRHHAAPSPLRRRSWLEILICNRPPARICPATCRRARDQGHVCDPGLNKRADLESTLLTRLVATGDSATCRGPSSSLWRTPQDVISSSGPTCSYTSTAVGPIRRRAGGQRIAFGVEGYKGGERLGSSRGSRRPGLTHLQRLVPPSTPKSSTSAGCLRTDSRCCNRAAFQDQLRQASGSRAGSATSIDLGLRRRLSAR